MDNMEKLRDDFAWANIIVCISPSCWADVPGQFKVFIDRCIPWCNTHEPRAASPFPESANIQTDSGFLSENPCNSHCRKTDAFFFHRCFKGFSGKLHHICRGNTLAVNVFVDFG